jgi:hypothetical protein
LTRKKSCHSASLITMDISSTIMAVVPRQMEGSVKPEHSKLDRRSADLFKTWSAEVSTQPSIPCGMARLNRTVVRREV